MRAAICLVLALSGCARGPGVHAKAKVPLDRDPKFLFETGKAYAERGDVIRAEQYLGAALSAGADEQLVAPVYLKVCVSAHHYRLAVEYAEGSLARHPTDAHLRFLTGALHVSIGEPALAKDYLRQAARELPNDPNVQFAVAVFFRDDLSDKAAADPYFREYLRLAPQGLHAEEARVSLEERVQ